MSEITVHDLFKRVRQPTNTEKLLRFTRQLTSRFERLAVDEAGVMDPNDKKLLRNVRKYLHIVSANHEEKRAKL